MADDNTAPRHPSTGDGKSASGGGNAFTRKLGPLPVWAWMGIGLGAALAYSSWRKNKATSTSQASTVNPTGTATGVQTASQTPPFIIQNYTTGNGGGAGPRRAKGGTTTGASSTTSVTAQPVGSSAAEEPYLYGHQQLDYLQQHLQSSSNPAGYTQGVYQDVSNAYMQVVHSQGQNQADSYHYSWIAPGNVQAIPQNALSVSQVLQNLP